MIVDAIITNLSPKDLFNEVPGLPAHVLFMCVLYADYSKNASMLQGLLTRAMQAIKAAVLRSATELSTLGFWMTITFRLLNDMKQFGTDAALQTHTDAASRRLENFDLQEYRMVLSDLLVNVYHTVVKHIEHHLTPLLVPGVLEHESIQGMHASTPMRRTRSAQQNVEVTIKAVVHELAAINECLQRACVEPRLVRQVFDQVFYLINATVVNTMLLRKDLCHWSKGMQIRCNLTALEEWVHKQGLEDCKHQLVEAVQLTQLLQVDKTRVEDVDAIRQCCDRLNVVQIQKILTMYSPGDGEDRVPAAVIRAVVERGGGAGDPGRLMLDTTHVLPVTFPFTPSDPKFATLKLPKAFMLPFMEKI